MPHDHHHVLSGPRAERPTLSLLRLSAVQRVAAAGLVVAVLWLAVFAAMT